MSFETRPIAFPLGAAGPFHRLQIALRLAEEDRPNVRRRVLACVTIAWLPLALLWWLQHVAVGDSDPSASLFTHMTTYARFFVTLPLLILAENAVRPQLEQALEHAITTGMVPPPRYAEFSGILMRGLQARDSRVAEAVTLALALVASHTAVSVATVEHHSSWIHTGPTLTWAGIWYAYVSLTYQNLFPHSSVGGLSGHIEKIAAAKTAISKTSIRIRDNPQLETG